MKSVLDPVCAVTSFRRRPESRKSAALEEPVDSGLRRNDVGTDSINGLIYPKSNVQRYAWKARSLMRYGRSWEKRTR